MKYYASHHNSLISIVDFLLNLLNPNFIRKPFGLCFYHILDHSMGYLAHRRQQANAPVVLYKGCLGITIFCVPFHLLGKYFSQNCVYDATSASFASALIWRYHHVPPSTSSISVSVGSCFDDFACVICIMLDWFRLINLHGREKVSYFRLKHLLLEIEVL